jgi:hypothetical protein
MCAEYATRCHEMKGNAESSGFSEKKKGRNRERDQGNLQDPTCCMHLLAHRK